VILSEKNKPKILKALEIDLLTIHLKLNEDSLSFMANQLKISQNFF